MIKDILKQSQVFSSLLKDIRLNKQAHTYLFTSPDEFTAKEMARLVAQALLCENVCGKCENCIKFEAGHPDVKYFPRKNQLLVEDSNFIVEESFVKPIFADRKIFVIDNFDKSTTEAQNKLLKVLEEPNSNMFYLLSTSSPEKVLPTIRSRCFKVEIGGFSKEEIERELKNVSAQEKQLSLSLGGGYLGKTIALSNKKNLLEVFNLATSIITKLKSSKEVIVYSKALLDQKEEIKFIFEIISNILEDLIAIKTNNKTLIKLDMIQKSLKEVEGEYSMKCISEIESLIVNAVKEIEYNTNLSLVIDNFLMNMLEVKYLCR